MCFKKLRKIFCGECKPEVITETKIETVEKVITKIVENPKLKPMTIINSNFDPKKQGTPTKDKENNKIVYDYLYSLNFKSGYYSQLESVINIKINKNKNYIEVNKYRRLCSDGDFI